MIFVDTGAWIALSDRRDQFHEKAKNIYLKLKQANELLMTTDYIIDETITRLRYDVNHSIAIKFLDLIERVEKTNLVKIIWIDESLFQMS